MTDLRRLPGPMADIWEWQILGNCRGRDSELFFHPEGERGPAREARERAAKAVCAHCPVLQRCGEHALRSREPYGVWGGMSETEREALLANGGRAPGRRAVATVGRHADGRAPEGSPAV